MCGAQVVGLARPGVLLAEQGGDARPVGYRRLIIATGARERFLPFPGWTLPGVMGVGGLQAMVKMGMPIEGKRVVIAGTGPLLLAVAAYLVERRAEVSLIAEQASWASLARFGASLLTSHWGKLAEAVKLRRELRGARYRPGCWPIKAEGSSDEGNECVARVVLSDGSKKWSEPCDYLACGFDLIPNLELPLLLGCATRNEGVRVDEIQQTSVADIHCAGESTGIGGVELSLIEGQIAGYAAAGNHEKAWALFAKRRQAERFARSLRRAFRLRPQLEQLAREETIVCRGEDVTLERLRQYDDWRTAKLHTRCGMGPCQGRVCGAATRAILDWPAGSVRPPILPARLATLADARTKTSDKTDRC